MAESPETFGNEPESEVWDTILHQLALDIEFNFKTLHVLPLFGPDDYGCEVGPEMEAWEIVHFDYVAYLHDNDKLREQVLKESFNGDESAYFDFVETVQLLKVSTQSRPDLLQYIRAGDDNTIVQLEELIDGATPYVATATFSHEKKELAKQHARQIYTTPSVTMKNLKTKQFKK